MIQTNPTFDHFNSIIQTNDNMTSFGKKVPVIGSDFNFAQYGSWKSDLGAYFARNDMQAWSSLDSSMPDEYPRGDPKAADYNELCKRFKSRFGIDDEYEFEGNSEKAWAVLHEATRNAPDLNRIINLHKGQFKPAFVALEAHVTGNVKTASRNMRRELMRTLRECNSMSSHTEPVRPLLLLWLARR